MTSQTMAQKMTGLFKIFSRIPVPVPDRPAGMALPSLAIIREVRFRKSGKTLKIDFSKRPVILPLNNNADGKEFDALLVDIAKKTFAHGPNSLAKKPDLSLNNTRLCYIVFRLSDDTDWQFAHDFPPVSLSPEAFDSGCYFEANRINNDGIIVPMLDKDDKVIERDDCRVAYFIADGAKAVADNPIKYIHPYNLNVDFLEMNGAQIEHRLAVTIDPDVRNPGGGGG